jgi:hypothetical protein
VKVAASRPSTSSSSVHCPTCREPVSTGMFAGLFALTTPNLVLYSPVPPDTLLIPPHLRPYVHPPFRRIYLNTPAPSLALPDPDGGPKLTAEVEKAAARLHMENAVLRQSCYAWHARAHAHMTAHFQLSAFVRMARDQARKLKDERDEIARKYASLKRKFSDVDR